MTKKQWQTSSEPCDTMHGEEPGTRGESLLSPRRAFVVQFREELGTVPGRFTGRVEHIVSGHATRFHSPEELLTFFAQVLNTIRAKPP
jgi:hypothetical protein